MGLKIIITGTTGMVGEGVLLHCLRSPQVERVLSVSRKGSGHTDPKLVELLVKDFTSLGDAEAKLAGYDACFYCAGISSVGMSEADYTKVTFDTPVGFATVLARQNPGMVLVHVTGRSTDSTEQGKVMWARVKGRAENALMKLPLRAVYNFRPALMKPVEGQRHIKRWIAALAWMAYPIVNALAPESAMTLDEVGDAMIRCATAGAPKPILEVRDIQELARGEGAV